MRRVFHRLRKRQFKLDDAIARNAVFNLSIITKQPPAKAGGFEAGGLSLMMEN